LSLSTVLLATLLAAAFYNDARRAVIPNVYTLPSMAAGLLLSAAGGSGTFASAGCGLLAGFALMLPLYAVGAVGAGDVKLFGAIGALSGTEFVLHGLMNSVVAAGAIGLGLLAAKRQLQSRMGAVAAHLFGLFVLKNVNGLLRLKQSGGAFTFPFMYAVVPGIAVTWSYIQPF
jgi:prepilin peptidase CpaA